MYITKEMQKDFDENITWTPYAANFDKTLEEVCDALAVIGYRLEIKKEK